MKIRLQASVSLFIVLLAVSLIGISGCKSTEIKDGQTAYRLKRYTLAAALLQQDFQKAADKEEKAAYAMMIGNSYRFNANTPLAEEWYMQAVDITGNSQARAQLADMMKANEKYDEAIGQLQILIKEEPFRRAEYSAAIAMMQQAKKDSENADYTEITNLSINSTSSDFSPVPYKEGSLIFSSSRAQSTGEDQDGWTGNKYYDLYIAEVESGSFITPALFSTHINTDYNEAAVTFNKDFTEMYFTQCGSKDKSVRDLCQIYYSVQSFDNSWSQPEIIKLFEDSINVGQPVLNNDGNRLIFAANDPQGYGGTDLYYSIRSLEGWSSPVNLGSKINTSGDEAFPYLDPEGNLYFSSNGLPGYGGLDIWKASPVGNLYENPEHLSYPINTGADDFGVIITPLSKLEKESIYLRGYLSSNRKGGKGEDDIYRFVQRKPPGRYVLAGTVVTPRYVDPSDPKSAIIDTVPLADATVEMRVLNNQGETTLQTFTTDRIGRFRTDLDANIDYKFMASKDSGYLSDFELLSTRTAKVKPGETKGFAIEILLDRIIIGKQIEIPNIYYDFGEWYIREDAAAVLDSTIYVLLKNNPSVNILMGSHTDARGSKSSNEKLAQKRAQAAVDYLVEKGIDGDRLKAKGYGESQPVNNCVDGVECTEEEHQRNRRTTFEITGLSESVKSSEPENIIVDPKD